jgi:omega-amidase
MIVGSFAVKEGSQYFNRVCCVQPDGTLHYSDKRHLFRMGEEHANYTPGTTRLTVDWKGWKICPLICYDLRFPVWSRNSTSEAYDLLIYVANWPARRANAWNTLLAARAIENQAFVAGVNRVGNDGNGIMHQGESVLLDFLGEPLLALGKSESIKTVRISKRTLNDYRKSFPAHLDADPFQIL